MADFFIPTSTDEFRARTNASLTSSHARDSPQYTGNISQETPSQHFPAPSCVCESSSNEIAGTFRHVPTLDIHIHIPNFRYIVDDQADRDHTEPVISGASPVEMDQAKEIAERARALAAEVLAIFKDNEEAVVILVEREQVVFKLRELTRLSTMFEKMNWEPGVQVHVWRIMDVSCTEFMSFVRMLENLGALQFISFMRCAAPLTTTQLPRLSSCPGFDTLSDLSRMATPGETGDRGRPSPVPNWASPPIPPPTPMSAYTLLPNSTTRSVYVIPDSSSKGERMQWRKNAMEKFDEPIYSIAVISDGAASPSQCQTYSLFGSAALHPSKAPTVNYQFLDDYSLIGGVAQAHIDPEFRKEMCWQRALALIILERYYTLGAPDVSFRPGEIIPLTNPRLFLEKVLSISQQYERTTGKLGSSPHAAPNNRRSVLILHG
ncbi:hypothetical protein C8J56DRAFT_1126379 [Mycena floridula]|nr:hypothetical protein C8J56DRAFT_1126379 [Mycena floridula]